MAGRTRSRTYDVLAVSSTVHKANADYLAGILRYASGRPDWRLWLFNPMADFSFGKVLPTRRASRRLRPAANFTCCQCMRAAEALALT